MNIFLNAQSLGFFFLVFQMYLDNAKEIQAQHLCINIIPEVLFALIKYGVTTINVQCSLCSAKRGTE